MEAPHNDGHAVGVYGQEGELPNNTSVKDKFASQAGYDAKESEATKRCSRHGFPHTLDHRIVEMRKVGR